MPLPLALRWSLVALAMGSCAAAAEEAPPVVQAIRAEALRPNGDPAGRPLPLAAHWNRGEFPEGWGPAYQLDLLKRGRHILPWFTFPQPDIVSEEKLAKASQYYEDAIRKYAAWKAPITLVGTQWESSLYLDARFRDLPPEKNPNVVNEAGKVLKQLDPFGPVEPWVEVGRAWTDSPLMKKLEAWYPDPPLVLLLSNNEATDLRWHKIEQSKRYLEKYGPGRDDDFKRKAVGDAWIERYRALQKGMREGLAAPAWRDKARFIAYDAFGPPHFARWGGWLEYSQYTKGRISPAPLEWDGGSPSYYTHNWNASTDFKVWSPQVESMNWVFMLDEAWRLNPQFWFEFSVWDGTFDPTKVSAKNDKAPPKSKADEYRRLGQTYTPERYKGFCQFGLWLVRPRVVREFRGWVETRAELGAYYDALLDAVDAVWTDETLQRFWRRSDLVPNRAHKHPYQTAVPAEYADCDRWFLLDTSLDAPWPWRQDTEIPVWALARVLGAKGAREWLVYAHSPLGPRKQVGITLPDYGVLQVDVAVEGCFYAVNEEKRVVTPVGRHAISPAN